MEPKKTLERVLDDVESLLRNNPELCSLVQTILELSCRAASEVSYRETSLQKTTNDPIGVHFKCARRVLSLRLVPAPAFCGRPVVFHVCANNDRNGNPRRAFVIYTIKDDGDLSFQGAWDEGYSGADCVPSPWVEVARNRAIRINVTAGEYKLWLKRHGEWYL